MSFEPVDDEYLTSDEDDDEPELRLQKLPTGRFTLPARRVVTRPPRPVPSVTPLTPSSILGMDETKIEGLDRLTRRRAMLVMDAVKTAKPSGFSTTAMGRTLEYAHFETHATMPEALFGPAPATLHILYQLVDFAIRGSILEAGLLMFVVCRLGPTDRGQGTLEILYDARPAATYTYGSYRYSIARAELM